VKHQNALRLAVRDAGLTGDVKGGKEEVRGRNEDLTGWSKS